MSWKGDLIKAGISSDGKDVDFYRGLVKINGKSETPDTTAVTSLIKDSSGDVLLATGTSVPGADETGFAKGCLFIKTDAGDGTKSIYENQGTNTASDFNLQGGATVGEITLAQGSVIVGDSNGVGSALDGSTDAQILIGDGSDVVSVAVSGDVTITNAGAVTIGNNAVTNAKIADELIQVATVTVSNSEIKALAASPKTLVAAPGASKAIEFVSATLKLNAGSEVLTESADNLAIKYTDAAGAAVSQTIEATGFIDQSADTQTNALPAADTIVASASAENQALVLDNTGDGEYGGNASNDATMTVKVVYRVLDFS